MNSNNKRVPSPTQKQKQTLPPGHEWLAVSAWRISRLEPSLSVPPSRTHHHLPPVSATSGTGLYNNLNNHFQSPEEQAQARYHALKLKTKTQTLEGTNSVMRLLEDLKERFQLTFFGLPSEQQIALRDRLQEADLAFLHYQQQLLSEHHQVQMDHIKHHQNAHDASNQLKQLAARLKTIITQAKQEQERSRQARKAEEEEDQQPIWQPSFQTVNAMIEAVLMAITSASLAKGTVGAIQPPPLTAPPGNIRLRRHEVAKIAQSAANRQAKLREKTQQLIREKKNRKHQRGVQPVEHKDDADATF